jgi:hypothetical protein
MRYFTHPANRLLCCALLLVSTAAGCAELSLGIDDIESAAFSARGIKLVLPVDGSAHMQIAALSLQRMRPAIPPVQVSQFMQQV